MDDDRRIAALRIVLGTRPLRVLGRETGEAEAAVALVVRAREEIELLLIKRTERAGDPWSGHAALPGGRRQSEDADLLQTALRETEEETDIALSRIGSVLGALDEVAPRSPLLPRLVIAPYVVAVPPDTSATPNPREVDAAVWIPLSALSAPGAAGELVLELESERRSFPALHYGEHVIWGLTHRILTQFIDVAVAAGL